VASQVVAGVAERYDRGGLWAAVVVMAGWHVVATLPVVISGWLRYGAASSGAAIWLVYGAAGAVAGWVVLRGGGRSLVVPLVVCPILLAGVVAGSLAAREGFFGPENWPYSVAGWFALVALWRRSLAELLAFFAANTATGAAMLVVLGETGRVSFARFVVVSCGVSILQVTIFVGSRAVTATARRGAEAEEALTQTRNARLAAEAVRAARKTRYETIRATVVHLLGSLATGQADLADAATRQQIAVAVTRLRRYIAETDDVPDRLTHELRACADTAARRGIAVDLLVSADVVPPVPVEIRRALTEPVIGVLAATASQARITVVASAAEVVIAALADAHLAAPGWATHPAVQVEHDMEGDLLWVQARWTGQSESPS
jgi:hypothetical protein